MGQPVVHFEVVGKDGAKLQEYYSELFGWEVDADNPMNYGMVSREGNLGRDGVDRTREGLLVRARRLRETADLAHVLKGGGADLVVGRFRLEVVERLDVSAHAASLAGGRRLFTTWQPLGSV